MAEPAGRSPRAGVRVTAVLGDPLAPRAFSLIAIHKRPAACVHQRGAGRRSFGAPTLSAEQREDLTHLPIVAIDPSDARDHDDAIWAEPDGEGGWRALVAIADVFYVRPGMRAGSRGAQARQFGLFPRPRGADAARSAVGRCLFAEGRRAARGHGMPHDDSMPKGG
jgi:ribonuclease R